LEQIKHTELQTKKREAITEQKMEFLEAEAHEAKKQLLEA
jgi:hypothetical protein